MEIAADNSKRKYFNSLNAPSNHYGVGSGQMQFSPLDTSVSPENNFSYSFSMSISSEEERQQSPAVTIDPTNHYKFSQTKSSDNNTSTDISAYTSNDSSSMTISNPTHSQSSTDVMSCCPIISDSQENAELREFAIEVLSDLLVNSFDHNDKEQIISNAGTILGRKENGSLKNKLLFKSTDNEEQRQFTMEVLSDFLSNSFDEFDSDCSSATNATLPYNSSKERINTYFTPMSSVSTTSDEPASKKILIAPTKTFAKPNNNHFKMQQNLINTNMMHQTPITPIQQKPSTIYLKPIPPQDIFVNLKEYLASNNLNIEK